MTMYDHAADEGLLRSRAARAAALLALAAAFMFLPPRLSGWLRRPVQAALRPGQLAAAAAGEQIDSGLARLRGLLAASDHYAELEQRVQRLQSDNARLQAAVLALSQNDTPAHDISLPAPEKTAPLVTTRLIEARVIGQQLQSLLAPEASLAAGNADGLRPRAWALDAAPALIDQGTAAGIGKGGLILSGRRVLGKVRETTAHTSRLEHPASAGYRDLVQLAYRHGDRITLGPRGVLEGTGEPLCRVRRVPVTQSVSVGDVLLTAGGEGIASAGLYYGEVVRVERPAGATHWEIWMQPAVGARWPDKVAVVSATVTGIAAAALHSDAKEFAR